MSTLMQTERCVCGQKDLLKRLFPLHLGLADIVPENSMRAVISNASSSVTVSWLSPASFNGRIVHYILQCKAWQGVSESSTQTLLHLTCAILLSAIEFSPSLENKMIKFL